jgi:GNAT superfamily N-acetyltransferase
LNAETVFRPGTPADSYAAYTILDRAVGDFTQRNNLQSEYAAGDPQGWERNRPQFEHLAQTADLFWVAEEAGKPIGYARSIFRDGVRELTEFFVVPSSQSSGVGRELLARAFPAAGARHRAIIATSDSRALGRYLRAGVYPLCPIFFFGPGATRTASH